MRCRKCGDRFEIRNPEMPPPAEVVESPRVETEPDRERESDRFWRRKRTHPSGRKTAYLLAGSIVINLLLGATVAFLVHPGLRWGLPFVPGVPAQDVNILSSHYTMSSGGVQMFVIQGSVRDIRKGEVSAPIRLRAKLFDDKKGLLAEKMFLAGSAVPVTGFPAEVYYLLNNTSLKKGWLPFVVVFPNTGVIADFSITIEPM